MQCVELKSCRFEETKTATERLLSRRILFYSSKRELRFWAEKKPIEMEIAEKKEKELDNNTQSVVESADNNNNDNKDAEERLARDLKTGLHPLKVSSSSPSWLIDWILSDVS